MPILTNKKMIIKNKQIIKIVSNNKIKNNSQNYKEPRLKFKKDILRNCVNFVVSMKKKYKHILRIINNYNLLILKHRKNIKVNKI